MKIIYAGTRLTCTTVYQFGTMAMEGAISWRGRRRSFSFYEEHMAQLVAISVVTSSLVLYFALHCCLFRFVSPLSLWECHLLHQWLLHIWSLMIKGINNHRNPCILCSLVSKTNGRNLLRGPLKLVLVALSHQSWKKGRLWRWLLMSSRQWQLWMIFLKRKVKVLLWIISYSYE